ncbi:MAG: nitronate monooxygenase [Lentisphaeria bacterium]|nr:nitronate monooxygenase [Lentisphaeria bacterium]
MAAESLCEPLFRRGGEFLGVRHPILCGAMTWISDSRLVAAVCNAGGFGCLAAGNAPVAVLEGEIQRTRELTRQPFAVNLVTIAPLYREHLDLVCRMRVPFVIFAGSFPREGAVRRVRETGARVLCFASTDSIAMRMIRYGADGLILEGMEAGGHVGHVSLAVLLQQVLFRVAEVPVFVAGGIASGRLCAHLFLMGAAGVQLGTRFAVAHESCAHAAFKDAFLRANARDAVSTPQFDSRLPVVAVRALRNQGHADFARLQLDLIGRLDRGEIHRDQAQLEVETFWMGALRRAVQEGDVGSGSLMAGQSVGLVDRRQSVAEILAELVGDTEQELRRVRQVLCSPPVSP